MISISPPHATMIVAVTRPLVIVSEWNLSVPDDIQWTDIRLKPKQQPRFLLEVVRGSGNCIREAGWMAVLDLEVTWAELGDCRWSYQNAVIAGVIHGFQRIRIPST